MKGRVLDGGALLMRDDDAVATALDDLQTGDTVEIALDDSKRDDTAATTHANPNTATSPSEDTATTASNDCIKLVDDIPFGHKFAIMPINEGKEVVKYGETIGRATEDITPGEWVHTHNCESTRGRGDLANDTDSAHPTGGDQT